MKTACVFLILQFWRLSPLEYMISVFHSDVTSDILSVVESNGEELITPTLSVLDILLSRFIQHGISSISFGDIEAFLQSVVEADIFQSEEAQNLLDHFFNQ